MMIRTKITSLVVLLLVLAIASSGHARDHGLSYVKDTMIIKADFWDWPTGIKATPDSGFIIAGWQRESGDTASIHVIKFNSDWTIAWDNIYGKSSFVFGFDIQLTKDGSGNHDGYIIAGHSENDPDSLDCQAYLLKLDTSGNSLWAQSYGAENDEQFFCVAQTSDLGYIAAGRISSGTHDSDSNDVFIMKIDSLHNTVWTSTYGGPREDMAKGIVVDTSGGYIIVGQTRPDSAAPDMFIMKVDDDGDSLWQKTLAHADGDYGLAITATSDGNFVMVGAEFVSASIRLAIRLKKFTSDGTDMWDYTHDYVPLIATTMFLYPEDVSETTDGGFVVSGSAYGGDIVSAFVATFDSEGIWLQFRLFGGSKSVSYMHGVIEDPSESGTFISAGWSTAKDNFSENTSVTDPDIWIVKLEDYVCGDADGSGSFNIADITFLIAIFNSGGPLPTPLVAGDVNGDCSVNIADVTYLITHVFNDGPAPICAEECVNMK